jgi:polyribonucleotide nucleotidyltransferase
MYKASIDFEGREYSIETGRFAKFAVAHNGAQWRYYGFSYCGSFKQSKQRFRLFATSVEYREKAAAAGKFPGGFLNVKKAKRP